MSWHSLGAVAPNEGEWRDYSPSTEAPETPADGLVYRLSGLNVLPLDPDQFYALLRFRYGDLHTPETVVAPVVGPNVIMVDIPPRITIYPFVWVPQVQLVFHRSIPRPRQPSWMLQIDEFVEAQDVSALSRFLY